MCAQNHACAHAGSSNLGELNLLLASTVMIRRSKGEVAQQLPDKIRWG